MLKPKRKITRKEIQVDPMLETMGNVQKHFETHKQSYTRYGSGLLILIIALVFFNNKQDTAQLEANAALGRAMIVWESKDWDNAEFQFELLTDEFGHTKSGKLGNYYLGLIYMQKGNKETALKVLNEFVSKNDYPMLESNARIQLADIYKSNNDLANAIKHLRQVDKIKCSSSQKHSAKIYLAELLLDSEKTDEAEEIVKKILAEDDVSDFNKNRAQQIFGMITG